MTPPADAGASATPTVLGDLLARDRRSDRVACRVVARDRAFSYHDFCTTAWKTAHVLRYLGVHAGGRVALPPRPEPEPIFTFFGSALVGATATFGDDPDARVALAPADADGPDSDRPGAKRLVYGGPPADPSVTQWERAVWSENPTPPPDEVDPDDAALESYTHREVLDSAAGVVADAGLDADDAVVLRTSLSDPRAVVAGVVAPLLAGGTVVLPDGTDADGTDAVGDVAVGEGSVPESRAVAVESVSL
ncbi:MAG: acetyl-CoA synthetase [Haloplanus sp.]